MPVVVKRPAADQVAVDDARLVDKDPAADFEVELAFRHRGHAAAADAIGGGRDFDAVADAGDREFLVEEVPCDSHQVCVIADVLRRAAAAEKDAEVFLGLYILERLIGDERVALEFACDRPSWLNLVEDHVVAALLGRDDDGLPTFFLNAIEGVERIDGFRGVADDDQDGVGHGGGSGEKGLRCQGKKDSHDQRRKAQGFTPLDLGSEIILQQSSGTLEEQRS